MLSVKSQQYRAILTVCFIWPSGYPPKHINWSDVCLFGNSIMLMYILLFLREMMFNVLWWALKPCIWKSNRGSFAPEYSLSFSHWSSETSKSNLFRGFGRFVESGGPFSYEPKHPKKYLWSRERGREPGTTWICSSTRRFHVAKKKSVCLGSPTCKTKTRLFELV